MERNTKILSLLALIIVILIAILTVGSQLYEVESSKNYNSSYIEIKTNTSTNVESNDNIIMTKFSGDHQRDGESVILTNDGEYYVVKDGYVLVDNTRIDLENQDKLSVYELNKAR